MGRRTDLVVPVRDRRQHRRILTLRNLKYALLTAVVAVAAVTIGANLRDRNREGFGRLYTSQLPTVTAHPKSVEPVEEAPIGDSTSADPMLVGPAARGQLLRADSNVQTPVEQSMNAPAGVDHLELKPDTTRVTITNTGSAGVVVQAPSSKPVLRGGFGR